MKTHLILENQVKQIPIHQSNLMTFSSIMFNRDTTKIYRTSYKQEFHKIGFGSSRFYEQFLFENFSQAWPDGTFTGLYADVNSCMARGELYQGKYCSHQWYHPVSCKKRPVCVYCGGREQLARASHYMDLVNQLSEKAPGYKVVAYELTFPQEYHKLLYKNYPRIRELDKLFFRALGLELARVVVVHDWHSKNPFNEPYPHLHGFAICLDKNFNQVEHYQDVDLWRKVWKFIINIELGPFKAENVNLKVRYHEVNDENRPKIFNRLKYMFRYPAQDIAKMSKRKAPEKYNKEFMISLLSEKPGKKRTQTYGWLADGCKNIYLGKIGIHHETRAEIKNTLGTFNHLCRDTCPICWNQGESLGITSLAELSNQVIICDSSEH